MTQSLVIIVFFNSRSYQVPAKLKWHFSSEQGVFIEYTVSIEIGLKPDWVSIFPSESGKNVNSFWHEMLE